LASSEEGSPRQRFENPRILIAGKLPEVQGVFVCAAGEPVLSLHVDLITASNKGGFTSIFAPNTYIAAVGDTQQQLLQIGQLQLTVKSLDEHQEEEKDLGRPQNVPSPQQGNMHARSTLAVDHVLTFPHPDAYFAFKSNGGEPKRSASQVSSEEDDGRSVPGSHLSLPRGPQRGKKVASVSVGTVKVNLPEPEALETIRPIVVKLLSVRRGSCPLQRFVYYQKIHEERHTHLNVMVDVQELFFTASRFSCAANKIHFSHIEEKLRASLANGSAQFHRPSSGKDSCVSVNTVQLFQRPSLMRSRPVAGERIPLPGDVSSVIDVSISRLLSTVHLQQDRADVESLKISLMKYAGLPYSSEEDSLAATCRPHCSPSAKPMVRVNITLVNCSAVLNEIPVLDSCSVHVSAIEADGCLSVGASEASEIITEANIARMEWNLSHGGTVVVEHHAVTSVGWHVTDPELHGRIYNISGNLGGLNVNISVTLLDLFSASVGDMFNVQEECFLMNNVGQSHFRNVDLDQSFGNQTFMAQFRRNNPLLNLPKVNLDLTGPQLSLYIADEALLSVQSRASLFCPDGQLTSLAAGLALCAQLQPVLPVAPVTALANNSWGRTETVSPLAWANINIEANNRSIVARIAQCSLDTTTPVPRGFSKLFGRYLPESVIASELPQQLHVVDGLVELEYDILSPEQTHVRSVCLKIGKLLSAVHWTAPLSVVPPLSLHTEILNIRLAASDELGLRIEAETFDVAVVLDNFTLWSLTDQSSSGARSAVGSSAQGSVAPHANHVNWLIRRATKAVQSDNINLILGERGSVVHNIDVSDIWRSVSVERALSLKISRAQCIVDATTLSSQCRNVPGVISSLHVVVSNVQSLGKTTSVGDVQVVAYPMHVRDFLTRRTESIVDSERCGWGAAMDAQRSALPKLCGVQASNIQINLLLGSVRVRQAASLLDRSHLLHLLEIAALLRCRHTAVLSEPFIGNSDYRPAENRWLFIRKSLVRRLRSRCAPSRTDHLRQLLKSEVDSIIEQQDITNPYLKGYALFLSRYQLGVALKAVLEERRLNKASAAIRVGKVELQMSPPGCEAAPMNANKPKKGILGFYKGSCDAFQLLFNDTSTSRVTLDVRCMQVSLGEQKTFNAAFQSLSVADECDNGGAVVRLAKIGDPQAGADIEEDAEDEVLAEEIGESRSEMKPASRRRRSRSYGQVSVAREVRTTLSHIISNTSANCSVALKSNGALTVFLTCADIVLSASVAQRFTNLLRTAKEHFALQIPLSAKEMERHKSMADFRKAARLTSGDSQLEVQVQKLGVFVPTYDDDHCPWGCEYLPQRSCFKSQQLLQVR
jgi:hypothetical protein